MARRGRRHHLHRLLPAAAVRDVGVEPLAAHLAVVRLGIVDQRGNAKLLRVRGGRSSTAPCRRRPPGCGASVTRLTSALSSSCSALSTSSSVRWPTRSSSRTPASAMRLAFTAVVWSDSSCRLRRLQLRPRRHHLRLRLRARLLDLLQPLDVRLLGLPHARLHLAARVERHRQPPRHARGLRPVDARGVVEALGVVGLQLRRRQQLAPHQLDR